MTLTATKFNLNTGAGPDQPIVSFSSVGATVTIGSLSITGSANNFAFLGDGSFETLPGFGVALSVGSATGDSFQWPSFLPIQIQSIGITWPDIQDDPANFTLTLSASVTSIGGLGGVNVTGAIQGIQIDPSLLAQGEFPIVGISSIAVTVQGDLFGGQIDAGLVGGILHLDSGFNIIAPTDTTTPVAHRVFYLGLEGGFTIDGMAGFQIQLGLSQLGPLDAFVSVDVPGGILLDPDTGLTINNFAGGVEFYKTLPSITDPMALNDPQFAVPTQLTAAQWLSSLQSQVAAQARATNGQANFLSAFTSPMTIIGSAEIYSIYTSQALFNGQVTVEISTDGKFLIAGQLNFFNNNVSISGKLYVDLSQVTSGSVTVLFLANVPTQVQLLTLYGKLQMGFENAQGQPVTFSVAAPPVSPTAASTSPGATVTDPAPAGGSADVQAANGATGDANSSSATYGADTEQRRSPPTRGRRTSTSRTPRPRAPTSTTPRSWATPADRPERQRYQPGRSRSPDRSRSRRSRSPTGPHRAARVRLDVEQHFHLRTDHGDRADGKRQHEPLAPERHRRSAHPIRGDERKPVLCVHAVRPHRAEPDRQQPDRARGHRPRAPDGPRRVLVLGWHHREPAVVRRAE